MNRNLEAFRKVLRWLPMTGSLTLMVMICLVSAGSFSQLKTADSWREHTYKVLAEAQTLLSDLVRMEGGARNYVFTGKAAVFKTFEESVNRAPQQLTRLKQLTVDNPGQRERLGPIGSD